MYGHRLLIPCCIVEGEGPGLVMQLKNCFFSRTESPKTNEGDGDIP